jgi:hypothetical protein
MANIYLDIVARFGDVWLYRDKNPMLAKNNLNI